VADADEARGQDVLEGEPGGLGSADAPSPGDVPFGAVLVAEGDVYPVVVGDAGVGDGDPVDVAGEVADHVARAEKRRLQVDRPGW